MDLGGVESTTREDRYSVRCQGNSGERVDEVSEYEEGKEGFCEFSIASTVISLLGCADWAGIVV